MKRGHTLDEQTPYQNVTYNGDLARLAWSRTVDFLRSELAKLEKARTSR